MSLLIIISGIVMLQMNYINTKERGYNSDEIIYVELDNLTSNYATLSMKNKLQSWPGILSVASSDIVPVNGAWGDHFKS